MKRFRKCAYYFYIVFLYTAVLYCKRYFVERTSQYFVQRVVISIDLNDEKRLWSPMEACKESEKNFRDGELQLLFTKFVRVNTIMHENIVIMYYYKW